MPKRSIVAAFLLSACFDPGSAPLNCSADAPACPDSLVCIDGRCVGATDDLSSPSADMASSDLAGDMAGGASGCRGGGGQRIGNAGAWLCPGVYGGVNPKASASCVGRICSDLSLFSAQDCKAVSSGFFTSAHWGSTSNKINPQIETCGSRPYQMAVFGCGIGDFEVNTGCSGFRMNMQATPANMLAAGSPVMIDTFVNTNPANGVICCP